MRLNPFQLMELKEVRPWSRPPSPDTTERALSGSLRVRLNESAKRLEARMIETPAFA